ncbi:MAG: metal-dependent transcriptional regulator [Clostridiales bacterium]
MKIQQSAEDYLETILVLFRRNGSVRSIDIVRELEYSKPSVSHAMKLLREDGYILMDESGYITLCEKGKTIAEMVYERHTFLTDNLIGIGVDPKIAKEDACRIEHVISGETFEKLKAYVEKNPII